MLPALKTGLLLALLVPVSVRDIKTRTIETRWSIALLICGILFTIYAGIEDRSWSPVVSAATGCGAALGLVLLCRLVAKDGLGGGDAKLMVPLGLFLGVEPFVVAMAVTGTLALLTALVLLLLKKAKKQDRIPFAPFLTAGAVTAEVLEWVAQT